MRDYQKFYIDGRWVEPRGREMIEVVNPASEQLMARIPAGVGLTAVTSTSAPHGCPDVLRLFSRHLEDEIDAELCARMQRHLDDCPRCRRACASLEQSLRVCQSGKAVPNAEIALAVLGSLREAHAMGIVHRDIKPANVFLQRVPTGGVKVLDFGIAKSTNEGTRAGLTREGQTIGTPAYMAPEQVKGAELGPETDLYALGLVLAEAVSGKPVYATDNGLAVLVDKLNGADPKLPAALVGTPLESVVRRATRHNREDRFRNADEMTRAIEAALARMQQAMH